MTTPEQIAIKEQCGNCRYWSLSVDSFGHCSVRRMPKVKTQWCGQFAHLEKKGNI